MNSSRARPTPSLGSRASWSALLGKADVELDLRLGAVALVDLDSLDLERVDALVDEPDVALGAGPGHLDESG